MHAVERRTLRRSREGDPFDVYSDVDTSRLDRVRLVDYLARYRNPKFIVFAKRVLELA